VPHSTAYPIPDVCSVSLGHKISKEVSDKFYAQVIF